MCWDGGLVQDKRSRTSATTKETKSWVLRFHFLRTVRAPALILSPCRHMFRSWPEESAAQWAGSDEPSEGGRAGGGTAGGGLPLNFQHRSVQDGMSDLFQPPPAHSLHAEGGPAQLKSSSERISGQKKRRHARLDSAPPPHCAAPLFTRSVSGLSQLELVLRSGVAKSGSSVLLEVIPIENKDLMLLLVFCFVLFLPEVQSVCCKVVATAIKAFF